MNYTLLKDAGTLEHQMKRFIEFDVLRYSGLLIRSRRLLLIGLSWNQKFVGPLLAESLGGDWRIINAAVPATLDGHTSNVCSILFSDTRCVLGS